MILVGIDDTDTVDSRGTNRLARTIADSLADRYRCHRIVRHQLLDDPRIPYTSRNGSASLLFEPLTADANLDNLRTRFREAMLADFIVGSDPGLCVVDAASVPADVIAFGRHCQHEVSTRDAARELAERSGFLLEGLGGTEDGVIGALAAIGLATTGEDGRIVHRFDWTDDLTGVHPIHSLHERGVVVQEVETRAPIETGSVDVGKKLRPNLRDGRATLLVRPTDSVDTNGTDTNGTDTYIALKLP